MKLGARVRFINRWDKYKANSGFYPPVGTLGTVTWINAADNIIEVLWDGGVLVTGKWWCNAEDVEVVEGEG